MYFVHTFTVNLKINVRNDKKLQVRLNIQNDRKMQNKVAHINIKIS